MKIKDICTVKMPRRVKFSEGILYSVIDITAFDSEYNIDKDYRKMDDNTNLLKKDDIVILNFDYTGNALGHPFLINLNNKYVAGIDTIILTDVKVNSKAFYLYLQSNEILKQVNKFAVMAITNSKRINASDYENIEINLDKIKELEKLDETIVNINYTMKNLYKELDKTKVLKESIFKEIFAKKSNWKKEKISDICEVKIGADGKPKNLSNVPTSTCKYPVITNAALNQIGYTDKCNANKDYILYNSRGSRSGDAVFVTTDAYLTNKAIIVKTDKVSNKFLSYELNYLKPAVENNCVMAGKFKEDFIYVPDIATQKEIEIIISEIDILIQAQEKELLKLNSLKRTLINK